MRTPEKYTPITAEIRLLLTVLQQRYTHGFIAQYCGVTKDKIYRLYTSSKHIDKELLNELERLFNSEIIQRGRWTKSKGLEQVKPAIMEALDKKYSRVELSRKLGEKYGKIQSMYMAGTFWVRHNLFKKINKLAGEK